MQNAQMLYIGSPNDKNKNLNKQYFINFIIIHIHCFTRFLSHMFLIKVFIIFSNSVSFVPVFPIPPRKHKYKG